MNGSFGRTLAVAAGLAALGACSGDYGSNPGPIPPPVPVTISATGNIAAKVEEFRALLGDPANAVAGEQTAGRREISWDGAGANPFDNRNDFPSTFFNTNVKAGAVFTTPGTGFRNDSLKFSEVNAEYANEFSTFSPTKIFSMPPYFAGLFVMRRIVVTGVGAVFSDVDIAGATTIEFFDVNGTSLGKIAAPVRSDAAGLSFVGGKFADAIVARVRITLGTGSLGANAVDVSAGGAADLVVADNFIYGEPKHIQ